MESLRISLAVATAVIAAAVSAAEIDMDDPRRALGREGDVRVDAQLLRDSVSPGMPIAVTYQIQNLSASSVAVAARVADASYDEDSRTITLTIGSEVPADGNMPQMIVIAPGEKKVLQTGATPVLRSTTVRSASSAMPRYVQVKVAILRDLRPFVALLAKQDGRNRQRLSDELFERWLESNDTILLNALPVRYTPAAASGAEQRVARGRF